MKNLFITIFLLVCFIAKAETLHFQAIDPSSQQLDFIENDCNNCFRIWGMELKSGVSAKHLKVLEKIKKDANIKDNGKSLTIPQLKRGNAIFQGQLLGYVPELNWKIEIYVNNPLTNERETLKTPVKKDGSFELKIPLVTTMQVLFRTAFYNEYILLSPDKKTTVYVDLYQKCCQETKNDALKCPAGKYMYFGGANAEINNQLEDKNIREIKRDFVNQAGDYRVILNQKMYAEQYKAYVLDKMNQAIEKLTQEKLTKKAYELAVIDIQMATILALMYANHTFEEAFKAASMSSILEIALMSYREPPVFDEAYYSFLKELSVNHPLSLYSSDFNNVLNSFKYLNKKELSINTTTGIKEAKSYLAEILGTSQGFIFDMMTIQFYCKIFEEKFPETDNEMLFAELFKPFAGKVVCVDFWATWCAPCRWAMKQFEPNKERLKGKDVVFIYLTDESSPLVVWQNMIPDIQGKHYRLKSEQFQYLKKKFGANGIPAYLILNKKGEQIYFKVGFDGADKLEELIMNAL